MSVIKLALGLGSLFLGAKHLSKGIGLLSTPQRRPAPGLGLTRTSARTGMKMTVHQAKTLDDRINFIRQQVAKGVVDPEVYSFARKVVNARCGTTWCVPEKDNLKEMEALFKAVRNRVRYTSDILNIDTYQHPKNTLKLNGGDCDDYSSLLCSLLLSVGIPCRLKVIRTKDSSDWNHIYIQGGLPRAQPTKWISLDASVAKPFGWEAPASMIADSRIFSVR